MANLEKHLINKVVSSKGLDVAVNKGINYEHFFNEKNREVWNFINKFSVEYGDVPSIDKLKSKFKDYDYFIVTDPLESVIDDFVDDYARKLGSEFLREMTRNIDTNPADMAAKFYEVAQMMEKSIPQALPAKFSDMKERIAEYKTREDLNDVYGILTGFPSIDELTLGFHPKDYITVSAFLGVGKSQMSLFLMWQAYLQGKTPMLITLEMNKEAAFRRFDAYAAKIKYSALKKLELGEGDLTQWEKMAEQAEQASGEKDIIVIDDMYNVSVDKVHAQIKKHKPDLAVIDYVSLMVTPNSQDGGNSYSRVQTLTRGLKQVARREELPIVGVAQLNREAGKGNVELTSMADSIAIAQDSDIVIALNQDESMREQNVMMVRLLKSRDSGTTDIHVTWDLDNGVVKERSGKHYESKNLPDDQKDNPFVIKNG